MAMPSWLLINRKTGMPLSGYVVLAASQAEIAAANDNLRARGSEYRYVERRFLPCDHAIDGPPQAAWSASAA